MYVAYGTLSLKYYIFIEVVFVDTEEVSLEIK